MKGFIQTTLVIAFRKETSNKETKYVSNYFNSNAKVIINTY